MDKHPLPSLSVIRVSQFSTDYGDHAHWECRGLGWGRMIRGLS